MIFFFAEKYFDKYCKKAVLLTATPLVFRIGSRQSETGGKGKVVDQSRRLSTSVDYLPGRFNRSRQLNLKHDLLLMHSSQLKGQFSKTSHQTKTVKKILKIEPSLWLGFLRETRFIISRWTKNRKLTVKFSLYSSVSLLVFRLRCWFCRFRTLEIIHNNSIFVIYKNFWSRFI